MEDHGNNAFMTKNRHWHVEECLKFIVEIKRRPVMWDSRIPEYRNKFLRGEALKEIAQIFAVSEDEVARKLRNLKTQFAEQLKKFKKHPPSGRSKSHKPKWAYFDAMRFMEDALYSKPTESLNHKKINKKEEMQLKELLRDDSIGEASIEISTSNDPVGLSLLKIGKNIEGELNSECKHESIIETGFEAVEIKEENLDEKNYIEAESPWEDELITHHKEILGESSFSELFHNKEPEFVFVQLPDNLPEDSTDSIRTSTSRKPSTSSDIQHNYNNKKLWTVEESFQFIVEIERRPVMWDCRIPEYRNKFLRSESVKEIAQIFAISEDEVARKLKNLKTQFAEQLKKFNKQVPFSSSGYQKPKWAYFDAMRFMEDAISNRPNVSLTNEDSDGNDGTNISTTQSVSRKRKADDLCEATESVLLKKNKVDEWQLFCDYLAEEFRNMEKKQQRELKQTIIRYIFKIGEEKNKREDEAEQAAR